MDDEGGVLPPDTETATHTHCVPGRGRAGDADGALPAPTHTNKWREGGSHLEEAGHAPVKAQHEAGDAEGALPPRLREALLHVGDVARHVLARRLGGEEGKWGHTQV